MCVVVLLNFFEKKTDIMMSLFIFLLVKKRKEIQIFDKNSFRIFNTVVVCARKQSRGLVELFAHEWHEKGPKACSVIFYNMNQFFEHLVTFIIVTRGDCLPVKKLIV